MNPNIPTASEIERKQAAQERAAFPAQQVRSETGLGASKASSH